MRVQQLTETADTLKKKLVEEMGLAGTTVVLSASMQSTFLPNAVFTRMIKNGEECSMICTSLKAPKVEKKKK